MQTEKTKVFIKKEDEEVLVVRREVLFANKVFNGIVPVDFKSYEKLIKANQEFLFRSQVETDIRYKQIIPYLLFNFKDKFFLMQRKNSASEARLKNKYSLGIGGHIRREDIEQSSLFDWAAREFKEEVNYSGSFKIKPIGILNDDSNSVGQVHAGFVFLLIGDSDNISVRSELKEGRLLTLKELALFYSKMENWSQIVFNFLLKTL